jgi:uncharacterized membrane protein YeaQ/YmgE (transglycosylase-associated protein family)
MLTAGLATYVFLLVVLPLAGLVGFGAGRMTRWMVRREQGAWGFDLLNIVLGVVGCYGGAVVATLNASLHEERLDGILIARRVTGLIDYIELLCFAGAIILPASGELLRSLVKKTPVGITK